MAVLWSSDGGATWSEIVGATANDGTHAWTCDSRTVSGNCLMRVAGIGSDARDTSDRAFTVLEPVTWLTATPILGSVPAGTGLPVELAFDTEGLPDGDYFADISITSSGGDTVAPVSLHVRSTGVDGRYPQAAVLYGCYPNPFNPETRIAFSVPARQRVSLAIYDVAGRLVRVLADDVVDPGNQFVVWDGRSGSGAATASGVYFCRFESGGTKVGAKLLLLK